LQTTDSGVAALFLFKYSTNSWGIFRIVVYSYWKHIKTLTNKFKIEANYQAAFPIKKFSNYISAETFNFYTMQFISLSYLFAIYPL
jgi:hypothetical protein